MAFGSAARFLLRGRGVWLEGVPAAFELALVQGQKLGLELLVFPFQLPVAAALLVQLAGEFLDDMLVMALRALEVLIAVPDPVRSQTLQIGAPVPVRAVKRVVQFREAGHRTSLPEAVGASAS